MRSNWVHIDIWFKKIKIKGYAPFVYLYEDEIKLVENFIIQIFSKIGWMINRKFYLYEPNPHLFIAIELKHKLFKKIISHIITEMKHPEIITNIYLNDWCGDDIGNGEGFLNILNAMTYYTLYKKDNKYSHIIHCGLNMQGFQRTKEIDFYKEMIKNYEIKRSNK